ncbi:MAG TPA: ABC transporter substrate-binding protein [Gaiella sp.]
MADPPAPHEPAALGSQLTRGDLLKRAGAAAFTVGMFGALPEKALGVYGPLRFKHKQLSGELRILQWAHFVPSYDQWLDNTYVKQWGEQNDVEVKVDHINNALLFSTASSEVAAQSGHDLFQFISPPSSFQKQVVPVNDIVQEVARKAGPMSRVGRRSTYNPKTKQFFGFPDNYAPDPVQYRRSFLAEAGASLRTWEDVRKAAPKLKQAGHPVGLGMSNEIDSNMFLISLLYCHGGFIQNEENRIVFNQGSNRRGAIQALELMRDIYRNGMSDEVFAWTAASNNQAFLAGRLSMSLNAISIARSAESSGNTALSDDTWLASIPRGPVMRLGNEHVMGVYVIWRFAKNKEAAKKFLVDQQLGYREHFVRSQYYNFPAWTGAIKGGFKTIRAMTKQDSHKPRGKYTILTTIAEKYTTNVGHPGSSNAVIDEIFNRYLIPQMFAQVAQGKASPGDAVRDFTQEAQRIYRKWQGQGLV